MFGLHVGDEFADLQVDEDIRSVVFAKRVGVDAAVAGSVRELLAQDVAQVVLEGVDPVVAFVEGDAPRPVVVGEVFVFVVGRQLGEADGGRGALALRGVRDLRTQAVVGIRHAAAGGKQQGEGNEQGVAHVYSPMMRTFGLSSILRMTPLMLFMLCWTVFRVSCRV